MTYNALLWSVISDTAPVWFSTASRESKHHLKTTQNAAARITTGCRQKAETQLLRVDQPLGLRALST